MEKVVTIIGARPQFVKYAPLSLELKDKCEDINIHTGQHYDQEMSEVFFNELNIPKPKYLLNVGSGSHGVQTGKMLMDLDPILLNEQPDAVIVFGDTNSTLAGALSAAKLNIPVIHIEAGLRSFNKEMPEELNRIATDHLSSQLFTATKVAVENLRKEGITRGIELTGDLMADSLKIAIEYIERVRLKRPINESYYLSTIHRTYNTDSKNRLIEILNELNNLNKKVIFPMHPRVTNLLKEWKIDAGKFKNLLISKPLGYFSFINTMFNSDAIITDSGGIQKEAYILKKPCITLRYETEWVETLEGNWNNLSGNDISKIKDFLQLDKGEHNSFLYGDGNSAKFIVEKILNS